MKIECLETVDEVDARVLAWLQSARTGRPACRLPDSFVQDLPTINGGIPRRALIKLKSEAIEVGRFLTCVDVDSQLPPPRQPSITIPEIDVRVERSIASLISIEGATTRNLGDGDKLTPFAALVTDGFSPDDYCLLFGACDLLCFTYPEHKIVKWDAAIASDESFRVDEDFSKADYSLFTTPVANSWPDFKRKLAGKA